MKRVVPGIHSVSEVLKIRPGSVQELWLREGELHGDLAEFLAQAQQARIKIKRTSMRMLDQQVSSHQGVIAYVKDSPPWLSQRDLKEVESGLILALDGLEDPHNVGSLMRSAWNLGVVGVIITKDRSAGLAPSAHKVASGAFEHIPVLEASNLLAELKLLKEFGFWVYGLSEKGEQNLFGIEFPPKTVLIIGAEEAGLKKPTLGVCDALIRIPQSAGSNSFNASVAGGIAGYEFLRQRNLSQTSKVSTK